MNNANRYRHDHNNLVAKHFVNANLCKDNDDSQSEEHGISSGELQFELKLCDRDGATSSFQLELAAKFRFEIKLLNQIARCCASSMMMTSSTTS